MVVFAHAVLFAYKEFPFFVIEDRLDVFDTGLKKLDDLAAGTRARTHARAIACEGATEKEA